MSTDCGCTPPADPVVPTPEICNPVTYDEPTATPEPCCLGCVFDELAAPWTKPSGEATNFVPVCDPTRYRVDQCVFIAGANGKGGVYHVTAVGEDNIEVSIHDGTTYDIGGAGNVIAGRVYPLPLCPMTAQDLIDIVSTAFPDEFVLAVHSTSDTTHGFALSVVSGQIKLIFNQTNFEAAVADALSNMGLTTFQPELTDTPITLVNTGVLNTSPFNSSGTIDFAADFSTAVPAGATHALLRIKHRLSSYEGTTGRDAEATADLEFAGNAATAVHNVVQHTGASNAVGPNQGHVNCVDVLRYVPITAGEVAWTQTVTAYPTPVGTADSADVWVTAFLVGWIIAL